MAQPVNIRVGVGGWTYAPWRDNFFPKGLPRKEELRYASRQLTAIEINGTYYRAQQPASFAKWHDETPDNFVFSVKASRYATTQRVLANAGEAIERFIGSGLSRLGEKLGPILWQFMPAKHFDAADFGAFLQLLPREIDGLPLRHAMDVRHASFMCPEYLDLARRHRVATVFADSGEYPSFADRTGDFVYARLMRCQADVASGYTTSDLDTWAERFLLWAGDGEPADLPRVEPPRSTPGLGDMPLKTPEVFVYFISGAKERAPAGALALLQRLGPAAPRSVMPAAARQPPRLRPNK